MIREIKSLAGENGDYTLERVKNKAVVKKFKNRNEFVQFYIENIDYITYNLNDTEKKTLFRCVMDMNINNVLAITSDLRRSMAELLSVSQSTISRGINSLIDKRVLIQLNPKNMDEDTKNLFGVANSDKNKYLINPDIVGKGSFRDMVKMREKVVKEFNFEQMEFRKAVEKEMDYTGLEEITSNPESHQIKNVKVIENDDMDKLVEIVVKEKGDEAQLFSSKSPKLATNKRHESSESDDIKSAVNELLELAQKEEEEYMARKQKRIEAIEKLQKRFVDSGDMESYKQIKDSLDELL